MSPMVSVIIPCYGVEKHLHNIFNDLSKQTFINSEFIFVNDGGSKTIDELTKAFSNRDKKVIAVRQHNRGVSSARNHGMEIAKGKWIVFVDPDDRLEDYFLESLVLAVENTNAEMGIGGFKQFYIKRGKTIEYLIKPQENTIPLSEALTICPPFHVPWNKIYKRDFLIANNFRFPDGVTYLEDEHFNLMVYRKVHNVGIVSDCGYRYMMYDENSALSKYHANLKRNMCVSDELRKSLYKSFGKSKRELHRMAVNGIALKIYILIINLYKKGTPLSFLDTVRYIRNEILDDKIIMRLFREHRWKDDKIQVKCCNVLICSRCSLLIATVFKTMFFIKYHVRNK